MPCKTDRYTALLGLVVGDTCEEEAGLVQMAPCQLAGEAALLSNFMLRAVKACCEESLKQLSGKALLSRFIGRKAAALFAGRVRWKLLRLEKSKREKKKKRAGFLSSLKKKKTQL